MQRLRFQLPDLDAGFTEVSGVLYLDDEFLVFEIETALLGEFDKEQQVIKIEPAALKDIRLDRGIVRDKLCIRPKTDALLKALPGDHLGEVQLKVWSTNRRQAEQLVEVVRARQ